MDEENRTQDIEKVKQACLKHRHTRFPSSCYEHHQQAIDGVNYNLVLQDASAGSLIGCFVDSNRGQLESRILVGLRHSKKSLEILLPHFDDFGIDEEGKRYFQHLLDCVTRVIDLAKEIPDESPAQ